MQTPAAPAKNRLVYLDLLRLVATVAVITIHVAAQNWFAVPVASPTFLWFNAVDSCSRFGVPLFVMLSGALWLDPQRPVSLRKLYGQSLVRLLCAFVFWSAVYTSAHILLTGEQNPAVCASLFVSGQHHMWYLFMIAGLYIAVPVVRKITESRQAAVYLAAIAFCTAIVPPSLTALTGSSAIADFIARFDIRIGLGYLFYFVLGYLLAHTDFQPVQRYALYGLGGVATVLIVWLTQRASLTAGTPVAAYYDYFMVFVALQATALFVFFRQMRAPGERTSRAIGYLARQTFGVYLSHVLVLDGFAALGLTTLRFHPVLAVPMLVVLVLAGSMAVTVLLRLVPGLRRYVI